MSILVVGSVALDTVKTPAGEKKEILGGSAVYFSVSASYFSKVRLVAVVGDDFPGKYVNLLSDCGVDLQGLEFKPGQTFRWEGEYGKDFADPQTKRTCLNVFSAFDPKIPEQYKDSKYLFLANIDPDLQQKVLKQVTSPKLIACDTMNFWIQNKRQSLLRLLKKVDMFFLNESEAKSLTGELNLCKAAKAVVKLGPKRVIIKKGEHGALLFFSGRAFCAPAFLIESVVDPTGAGDTFAGGVMGYIAQRGKTDDNTLRKAIVHGGVLATFTVEGFSLQRLISINKTDINYRVKQFRNLTYF